MFGSDRLKTGIVCFVVLLTAQVLFSQTIPTGTWVGDFAISETKNYQSPYHHKLRHGVGVLQMEPGGKGRLTLVAFSAVNGNQLFYDAPVITSPGNKSGMFQLSLNNAGPSPTGDAMLGSAFFSVASFFVAADTAMVQSNTVLLNPAKGNRRSITCLWLKRAINSTDYAGKLATCNTLVQKKAGGIWLKAAIRGGNMEDNISDQITSKFKDCLSEDFSKASLTVLERKTMNTLTVAAPNLLPVQLELEQGQNAFETVDSKFYQVQWKNPKVDALEPAKQFVLSAAQFTITNAQTGKKTTINYPQVSPVKYTQVLEESKDAIAISVGQISDFKEGFAIYRKGEQYGMIGGKNGISAGKFDFKFGPWQNAYPSEPLCGFYNHISVAFNPQTGLAGFIDTAGKVIIPFEWKEVTPFQPDGYAWGKLYDAKTNKEYRFFFDRNGRRYATTADGYSQEPFVHKESTDYSTTEFWRKNGKFAFKTNYRVWKYSDGLYVVSSKTDHAEKYGLMDTTGKLVVPFSMNEQPTAFNEGFALYTPTYKDEYEAVFIDKTGKPRIYYKKTESMVDFYNIRPFEYGYSDVEVTTVDGRRLPMLRDSTGNYYDINLLFRQANPQIFKDLTPLMQTPFKFDYYGRRNEWGLYVEAEFLLRPGSPTAAAFSNASRSATGGVGGGQPYMVSKGVGIIDYEGNILIPPVFASIGAFDPVMGLAKAVYNPGNGQASIYGFIDERGVFKIILQPPPSQF